MRAPWPAQPKASKRALTTPRAAFFAACKALRGSNSLGCSAHTLNEWVKKAEVDSGKRAGVPTEMADRLKALERENRELRQANEILRKASAYFAQAELDRPVRRQHQWHRFEVVI